MKNLIVLIILGCWLTRVHAQETTPEPSIDTGDGVIAYLSASNPSPQLGEPFQMTLTVEMPNTTQLGSWLTYGNKLYPLEILDEGEVQSSLSNNRTTYTQQLNVVLWQVGTYITPELRITYKDNDTIQYALVRSLSLTIPSLIAESANPDLRPSIPPQDLPYIPPYLYALGILIVSTVIFLLRRILKRRQGRILGIIGGDITQTTLAELEDLKVQPIPAETVYLIVAEKIRMYIQTRLDIKATDMTTQELSQYLRETDALTTALIGNMQTLLDQVDLVKFAKFEPENNTVRFLNFAIRWIHAVNRHLMESANG